MTTLLLDFAVALFIGLLTGIDRERKKTREHVSGVGGIRTFMLISLAGGASVHLARSLQSPWIVVMAGIAVTACVIASMALQTRNESAHYGQTTEISSIVVFLLGALAVGGYRELAVILGILTSAILAYKQPIHQLVDKIGEEDMYAIVKLLAATFIILPILPNHTIDPYDAINPYKIWWLVILISALSLIGYVATRWLGAGRGASITGFFGGLVSSTAVTLTFSRRSRDEAPSIPDALACGLLLAWVIMFIRIIAIVAVLNPPLVLPITIRLAAMLVITVIAAGLLYYRSRQHADGKSESIPLKNPFSLVSAMKFAALFAAVLFIVKLVESRSSGSSMYAFAAIAGTTDVDAITLSMSSYAKRTGLTDIALNAITIAAISNTIVKCALAAVLGTAAFRSRIAIATLLILAAGIATLLLV